MDFYKEKELHIILFFLEKQVKHFTITKLFKLLFYFDESMMQGTGRQGTTLDYFAFPHGPVPEKLLEEMREIKGGYKVPDDFKKHIKIDKRPTPKGTANYIAYNHRTKYNPDLFSPRELGILDDVVKRFKNVSAEEISDISHTDKGIWLKTVDEKGKGALIDLTHAISPDSGFDLDQVRQGIQERKDNLRL